MEVCYNLYTYKGFDALYVGASICKGKKKRINKWNETILQETG